MLRVSHLRKLVKPSAPSPELPCPGLTIALLGTEVGAPVSAGLTVEVLTGTVTATGAGYDFTNAVLRVITAEGCPVSSEMTFSITGTGPIPPLRVRSPNPPWVEFVSVPGGLAYAALKNPGLYPNPYWAIKYVPVSVPVGAPYEFKCSIADTWVGIWLNGTRLARAVVTPEYLKRLEPWEVLVGRNYGSQTYTGHVDSVRLAYGALPDIDVL